MQHPLALTAFITAAALTACDNPADSTFTTEATEAKEIVEPVATQETVTLALTGENTTVEWTGSKPTGSKHDGGFKTITGSASLAEGKLTAMDAKIDITSMWSDNDGLTKHLLNPDFFESETYPESRFVTSEIRAVKSEDVTEPVTAATHMVTGNFTLRGVTKSITFPAVIAVSEAAISLDSTFDINRGQFGMNYGLADAAIRDEVIIRLKLDIPRS